MNKLSIEKRTQMLGLLVEGNSLRATSRLTDISFNTVLKFVSDMGAACSEYQDQTLRNLPCKRIQCDEIWSFCYSKQKNVPQEHEGELGYGDLYTWIAICADTKLVPSWMVGRRDAETADIFMRDLAARLASRVQLTSDGYKPYLNAVEGAFGADVDFAMLIKLYGEQEGGARRYSPSEFAGTMKRRITGNPDIKEVSTSYVERQNLTMRMSMRRFTRLTNGFSKKAENHAHSVSIHYMYYNFGRIHKTLRVTPAMEAGVSDHVWSLEEIAALMDVGQETKKRGPYKKKISN